jgi:hypothetical protein
MPPNPSKQDLREISHLFLSGVRARQTAGATPPQRLSPQQRAALPVDLTADELAHVVTARAADRDAMRAAPSSTASTRPAGGGEAPAGAHHAWASTGVTCLLAGHLGGRLHDHARQYARDLARAPGSPRIGMVEVDACELRVMVFERNPHGAPHVSADLAVAEPLDGQRISHVLDELTWDVHRWVIVLPANPRAPDARPVVHAAAEITLLAAPDADGAIAAYRMIKGLADVLRRDGRSLPRLSLALVDMPPGAAQEAAAAHQKLSAVAKQFLGWPIERDEIGGRPGGDANDVAEHLVLNCRASHEKSQAASAPQWKIVADLVARATASAIAAAAVVSRPVWPSSAESNRTMQDLVTPAAAGAVHADATPAELEAWTGPVPADPTSDSARSFGRPRDDDDVIELPPSRGISPAADAEEAAAVLDAVLADRHWAACPIAPPQCGEARLAVTRERCLTLTAVAGRGLSRLRAIAQAYEWLRQNRNLVAMALPQFAIDAHAMPRLALLIDHADADADELRSILSAGNVSILTYRKLRWSGRTGLLLNAA